MKRFFSALALLLAVTALVSCSSEIPDVPEGMIEVTADNENVDFHLYAPDNWFAETSTGVVTAKVSDSILANVSVMGVSASTDVPGVEEYWAQFKDNFKSAFEDFELIEENGEVLLDGHKASRYVYSGKAGNSVTAKYQQVICLKDSTIYIFTYTADPEQYEEYLPDAEKMLEHFKFKD